MTGTDFDIAEQIQRQVAHLVATAPAGVGLCLVGGFRYRLLDRGVRRSVDVNDHWAGDVAAKQRELIDLFDRRLLPDVRRQLGLEGSVGPARGAAAESTGVAIVELAFWRLGSALGRIEIPVEITRIECVDPPAVRTADSVVYRTASDADMFESKVIAVAGRTFIEHRDLIDLYLCASHAAPDSPARLRRKFDRLGIGPAAVRRRLDDFAQSAELATAIDANAYVTGAHALACHGFITQVPHEIDCFTRRRHNRARRRPTPLGTLVFVCVGPGIHNPPASGGLADAPQALCDLFFVQRRRGLDPRSLYTFRNLDRLSIPPALLARYPRTVQQAVRSLLGSPPTRPEA